jgi:hypothetical protein
MVLTIKIMTREEKCRLFEEKGFTYNSENGIITTHKGKIQKPRKDGYIRLCIKLKEKKILLYGHHFAWWISYRQVPDEDLVIDHIDRDPSNNRITNLRVTTKLENTINSDRLDNCLGYYFFKLTGKWRASIKVDGKRKYFGCFDTEEEARQAYLDAVKIYYPDRYTKVTGQLTK